MRQILFDTETTGMSRSSTDKAEGHRIIELGCVELLDRQPSGNTLHLYFNPGQAVDPEAVAVHGLTDEFLADKPAFADCLPEIEAWFAGADEIIAHNAAFDIQFINRELRLAGRSYRIEERYTVVDTLKIAKQQNPGGRNSLDALCRRFHIDNSGREKHGALLDSELLLEVYLKLTGGQSSLFAAPTVKPAPKKPSPPRRQETAVVQQDDGDSNGGWLAATIDEAEKAAHLALLQQIRK